MTLGGLTQGGGAGWGSSTWKRTYDEAGGAEWKTERSEAVTWGQQGTAGRSGPPWATVTQRDRTRVGLPLKAFQNAK